MEEKISFFQNVCKNMLCNDVSKTLYNVFLQFICFDIEGNFIRYEFYGLVELSNILC